MPQRVGNAITPTYRSRLQKAGDMLSQVDHRDEYRL